MLDRIVAGRSPNTPVSTTRQRFDTDVDGTLGDDGASELDVVAQPASSNTPPAMATAPTNARVFMAESFVRLVRIGCDATGVRAVANTVTPVRSSRCTGTTNAPVRAFDATPTG